MSCSYDNSMYCTTPNDAAIEEPTNCYNCTNDCMGIVLEIFKEDEVDPDYQINKIFEEKGYYCVNTHMALLHGVMTPCLTMYSNEAFKFKRNMTKLGFHVTLKRNNSKKYLRNVFLSGYNPREFIKIFEKLDVIK